MNITAYPPPKPENFFLRTLIKMIGDGKLRIPAFQRNYVWTEKQIVELLESVLKGYPIGSLLFWTVNSKILEVQTAPDVPFPALAETYPLQYVLDGLQRLSTLYGVFTNEKKTTPDHFNVAYDLNSKAFKHYTAGMNLDGCVYLSDLFNPQKLLEAQAKLNTAKNADELISTSVQLQTAFHEYLVPTVTISERSVEDVVAMFHRINSMGTSLSDVDFMRALIWSPEFDLNQEIAKLKSELDQKNFDANPETLVKVIAVMDGKEPNTASMLKLRDTPPQSLHAATSLARKSYDRVIHFVGQELNIFSSEYIAYELLLLGLLTYFKQDDQTNSKILRAWFMTALFNEELRGKADSYVSNVLQAVRNLRADAEQPYLNLRLRLTADDLREKKFKRGAALSAGFACLFAANSSKSLISGEKIPSDEYMQEFDSVNFFGLLTIKQLKDAGIDTNSNKVLVNTVLVTPSEQKQLLAETAEGTMRRLLGTPEGSGVLSSQMISTAAANALVARDYKKFVEIRAQTMISEIEMLCKYGFII
jgi:hypothetical protein